MFTWDFKANKLVHVITEWDDTHIDAHCTINLDPEFYFEFCRNAKCLELAAQVRDITERDLVASVPATLIYDVALEAVFGLETYIHIIQDRHWDHFGAMSLSMITHSKFDMIGRVYRSTREDHFFKFIKSEVEHEPLFGLNVKEIKLPGRQSYTRLPREVVENIERQFTQNGNRKFTKIVQEETLSQLSLF